MVGSTYLLEWQVPLRSLVQVRPGLGLGFGFLAHAQLGGVRLALGLGFGFGVTAHAEVAEDGDSQLLDLGEARPTLRETPTPNL